jgi:hypothetical protein
MKRNLIVLGGVAVLILTACFVPVLSFPEKKWYMQTTEIMRLTSTASIGIGLIILWFMQTSSKWRGVLWIFLSVIGLKLTITDVQRQYAFFVSRGLKVDPNYISGRPVYEIGLYLIILGYLIIILGSVWDLIQKRRQEQFSVVSGQNSTQGNVE